MQQRQFRVIFWQQMWTNVKRYMKVIASYIQYFSRHFVSDFILLVGSWIHYLPLSGSSFGKYSAISDTIVWISLESFLMLNFSSALKSGLMALPRTIWDNTFPRPWEGCLLSGRKYKIFEKNKTIWSYFTPSLSMGFVRKDFCNETCCVEVLRSFGLNPMPFT